jgi:hypothetical protein
MQTPRWRSSVSRADPRHGKRVSADRSQAAMPGRTGRRCVAAYQRVEGYFWEGGYMPDHAVVRPTEHSECLHGETPLYDVIVWLEGSNPDPAVFTLAEDPAGGLTTC